MPQSHAQVVLHMVFGTKNRTPWIEKDFQPEMFSYLATVLRNAGHTPMIVGGHVDHVHLLFGLSRTESIAELVEDVKVASSKWAKTKGPELREFSWQRGYAAFGVSYPQVDGVVDYIANQDRHHSNRSFQDEYRALLKENGLEFNELYMWD